MYGHRFLTSGIKKIFGITLEECLDSAEAMFKEMNLEWDMEQSEKVRMFI